MKTAPAYSLRIHGQNPEKRRKDNPLLKPNYPVLN
jgi:hypothetical protein